MNTLTHVTLHGTLAEQIGQAEWHLAAKSVGEVLRGIQANTRKLYKNLIKNDAENIKYRVLINKRDFYIEEGKDPNTVEGLKSSELSMRLENLKSVDIIPVLEGADEDGKSWGAIIIGVMMVALGAGPLAGMWFSSAMVMGGIGLIVAGIANLLTPTPEFADFREIEGAQGRASYMFNGPENTIREGGPVFVGYGRLLVGSHLIQTSVDTFNTDAEVTLNDTWGEGKHGLQYYIPNAGPDLADRTRESDWTGE